MPPLPFIGAGALTLGASAPIFGLLGGLMYYSRRGGSSLMRSAVMGYVMSAVVFGILMPGIDNYAHAGGFAGGYLAGMLLDPLKPERVDHMVIAAVCLAASALAIAASLIVALWPMIMISYFGAVRRRSSADRRLGSRPRRNHFEYRSMIRADSPAGTPRRTPPGRA